MRRQIVIMGSGETSPTMVTPHQQIMRDSGVGKRVVLDTPFGFQENANELTNRLKEYFADSVGEQIDIVSRSEEHTSELQSH